MRYGEVLERSLWIFWRYRYLWLLGALGGGESVAGGGLGNFGVAGQGPGGSSDTAGALPDQLTTQFQQWFLDSAPFLIVLAVLLALFLLAYFVVSCVSLGATIRAAAEHDAERPFDLRLAWQAGLQTFLPILGLRLLGFLIALPALGLIGAVVLLAVISAFQARADGIVIAILAGLVLVPVLALAAIALGVVWTLAARSIVLEQLGVSRALRSGFEQLTHSLGRVALLWLIALGLSIVASLTAGIAAGVLLLPFLGVLAVTYATAGVFAALSTGAVLLTLYVVVVVLFNGAVGSFLTTYWTVAYRRLHLDPLPATPQPAAGV